MEEDDEWETEQTTLEDDAWDIRLEGRAWHDEAHDRFDLAPRKMEMYRGRLFWNDTDRLNVLGMLLENVGAERAVQLGDPAVWRAAVAKLAPN